MENGQCVIGMKKLAMIPLITFDLLVNVGLWLPGLAHLLTALDLPDNPLPHTAIRPLFVQEHAADEGEQEAEDGGAPDFYRVHLHPGQQHRVWLLPWGRPWLG